MRSAASAASPRPASVHRALVACVALLCLASPAALCSCSASSDSVPLPGQDASVDVLPQDGGAEAAHDVGKEASPGEDGPTDGSAEAINEAGADALADTTASDGADAQEAGQDGDSATAQKGSCTSQHLIGCYRGMYLSLYTDHIGQITFSGATEEHRYILGDLPKEQKVLEFIGQHRIESIALYDLGEILTDNVLRPALTSFMSRARQAGVLRVEAIAGTSTQAWDQIASFHLEQSPFDGFVTEIEFWNGGATLQQLVDTLKYVRGKPLIAPSGGPPTLSVYTGWVDQNDVDTMIPWIDRVYLHAYVDTAPAAFGYVESRLQMVVNANEALGKTVDVWPIYSAEDHVWAAGAETFMGEWLQANGMDAAETTFLTDFEADALHSHVGVTGHQYYEYFFLERYLP